MAQVLQTRSLPSRMTGWSDTVTFDQIDPSFYGSAVLDLTGTLVATAEVVNGDGTAAAFREVDTGSVHAGAVTVAPVVVLAGTLARGTNTLSASDTESASATYVPSGTGRVPSVFGTGTFSLPVYATASIEATGPGNMQAEFHSNIAATATLLPGGQASPGSLTIGSVISTSVGTYPSFTLFPSNISHTSQTFGIGSQATGWTITQAIAGFDPMLGRLLGVDVSIQIAGTGAYSVVNLDGAAGTLTVGQTADVTLAGANGSVLATGSAGNREAKALPTFNAASPATSDTYAIHGGATTTLTDPAALAGFIYAGAVALTASGTGSSIVDGPGNMAVATTLTAGATVTITYDYQAATDKLFDAGYYLAQNPDVKAAGVDPYVHFLSYGWHEGRDPSLLFSVSKYLAANPDVAKAGVDPLAHWDSYGQPEGRATFLAGGSAAADPLVNAAYYDAQLGATLLPTGTAAAQQAAWSYDTGGWQKGLNPDALFDTTYYLAHNPDVAAAHVDPLQHYETYGWKEGRDPSASFSTNQYLAAYGDVKAAGVDPLLHYVTYGQGEGRTAFHV